MKTLKMYAKPDKERYRPARKVQDIIPIQKIWADGVCQIGKDQYSKVWRCSDINYQMASDDDRELFNAQYQALLNSLESGCSAKVTVMNRRMDRAQFERDVLLPEQGDSNDVYRRELNDVLLEETNGGTGIVQERYITVSLRRKTVEEARRALQRIGAALFARLNDMGSYCEELDAGERCRILHDFFREGEESSYHFDLAEMQEQGYDFRDYICPDSAYHAADYLMLGNQYVRVEWIKQYANKLNDTFLYELMELDNKMFVTVDMVPIANDDGVRIVANKLDGIEADIGRLGQRQIRNDIITSSVPYELEKKERDARKDLDALQSKDKRMFLCWILVVHTASSKEQLDADTESLRSRAAESSCQLGVLRYQQMDALKSALPVGVRKLDVMRTMKTDALALFMPFRAQEVQDKGGIWYGQNAISDNLILIDRDKLKNQSAIVTGVPGAGKSVMLKEMIAQLYLTTQDDILICDPESEYGRLARHLGGEVIRIAGNSTNHINPLDMEEGYGDDGSDPLQDKVEFVTALFEELARGHKVDISWPKAQSILDRACKEIYEQYQRGGAVPTLTVLREQLFQQDDTVADELAVYLERFTTGTQGVFAHETNVDTSNRMIVYDIMGLGEQMKTLGLLVVTDAIINRVTRNWRHGKRTHIIIDEFHVIFQNHQSAIFFDSAWRRFRKRGGYPTAATQNVDTLLAHDESRAMLSNSEFLVLLSQADNDRKRLGELLDIPENQLRFVRNVPSGNGLLKYGNSMIPFRNEFPQNTRLYQLITTKPGEGVMDDGTAE